jgi:hypothetical protein
VQNLKRPGRSTARTGLTRTLGTASLILGILAAVSILLLFAPALVGHWQLVLPVIGPLLGTIGALVGSIGLGVARGRGQSTATALSGLILSLASIAGMAATMGILSLIEAA